MNLHLGTGEWIVIGICAALGIWFLAGIAVNRRVGTRLLERITGGMPGCSHNVLRWIDLSTVIVGFRSPSPAIERMEMMLALERRENLLLWLFQHAAGKRDTILLRAALRKKPASEMHLLPTAERALVPSAAAASDVNVREEYRGFKILSSIACTESATSALKAIADRFSDSLLRLSIRTEAPHVLVNARGVACDRILEMMAEISAAL